MRLLIIFLFTTAITFGQMQNCTVTKKDGTVLQVKDFSSKIKHLKLELENDETLELPYNQLDKIEYEMKYRKVTEKVTRQFVRISKRNGFLMTLLAEGNCNAYVNASMGYNGSSTSFYVKRENEPFATLMGSGAFVDYLNHKKTALEYFKDCPEMIDRVRKKFSRKKIKELVEFYNTTCL